MIHVMHLVGVLMLKPDATISAEAIWSCCSHFRLFALFPGVLRFYSCRTVIGGIYSFYVSAICLSCTSFCAYRLIRTGTAIFDFSPFLALFPGVLGFYGCRTVIGGIYLFYVSVICLSCTLCCVRLIWSVRAFFDFLAFLALFHGLLGFHCLTYCWQGRPRHRNSCWPAIRSNQVQHGERRVWSDSSCGEGRVIQHGHTHNTCMFLWVFIAFCLRRCMSLMRT